MTSLDFPPVSSHLWQWQGFPIHYQQAGSGGSPVILIHGFGAGSDHWRKNIPELAQHHRVYAIDLLGFGRSAKPKPGQPLPYTFETWGQLVTDFGQTLVGEAPFLIGNSIGCVVALQAAIYLGTQVRGVAMLNCSLRMLHERKRALLPFYRRWSAPLMQKLMGFRPFGAYFFKELAKPKVIRRVLRQAYGRPEAVTDELVDLLLAPAQDEGAADVFLAFIQYSQGPLAEDLLPLLPCPAIFFWGTEDPWEPIAQGRALANYPMVQDFVPLAGLGHCPQDEAPEVVNPLLLNWMAQLTAAAAP